MADHDVGKHDPGYESDARPSHPVLVVQIDGAHVFAHDLADVLCPAQAMEKCTRYYRRHERFADSHLKYEVVAIQPLPAPALPLSQPAQAFV
jgi:hypothetical protein